MLVVEDPEGFDAREGLAEPRELVLEAAVGQRVGGVDACTAVGGVSGCDQ